jgi:hypothetical protein
MDVKIVDVVPEDRVSSKGEYGWILKPVVGDKMEFIIKMPTCPYLNKVRCYNYTRIVYDYGADEIVFKIDAYPRLPKYTHNYSLQLNPLIVIIADIDDISIPAQTPIYILYHHDIIPPNIAECAVRLAIYQRKYAKK